MNMTPLRSEDYVTTECSGGTGMGALPMTAEEAIARLRERAWSSCAPGLERTRALLAQLGNPEQSLKYIHITGTNGKGSTAAILASVLRAAGYRTGLFTSPHLYRFHERMQVDGETITDGQLTALSERVLSAADALAVHPTEFELITALGMLYFQSMRCDIVVLEVGMGGKLDSTNVIPAPEVAVITNIGLEHTAILGDTLEKISTEKSGIIKAGCRAVLYAQTQGVARIVADACRAEGVPLTVTAPDTLELISSTLDGQVFRYRGRGPYRIALLGGYQLDNAMTALDAVEALREAGWQLPDEALTQGLASVSWPGRLEPARRSPAFLIDGAHNPQCAEALMTSLKGLFGEKKLIFLVGVLADKDWQRMLSSALPLAKAFVTITPPGSRSLPAGELAAYLDAHGAAAYAAASVEDAVNRALALAKPDDVICSWGSLYSVGEIRHTLGLC